MTTKEEVKPIPYEVQDILDFLNGPYKEDVEIWDDYAKGKRADFHELGWNLFYEPNKEDREGEYKVIPLADVITEEDITIDEALDLLDLMIITMEHIDGDNEDNEAIIEAIEERWPEEKTIRCMKLIRRIVAELGHLV